MTPGMSDLAPARSRPRGTRCPTCGARVTSLAPWCSLCFTDLAPGPQAPAPVPPVPAAAAAESAADRPGSAADDELVPTAADEPDADQVADTLLAELAATSGTTGPARWQLLSTTGGRVGVMLVGSALVTGLGFALLTLVGVLL